MNELFLDIRICLIRSLTHSNIRIYLNEGHHHDTTLKMSYNGTKSIENCLIYELNWEPHISAILQWILLYLGHFEAHSIAKLSK